MTNDIFIDSYKRNNHLGFPLDPSIYLEKNYINPITKILNEDTKDYQNN